MNPISWVTEKIVSNVVTLIGSVVIANVEAEALKNQAEALNGLEAEARKYEAEGNLVLAKMLRQNVESLANGTPGERTARIVESFQPAAATPPTAKPKTKNIATAKPEKKKKRGRPPKNAKAESKTVTAEATETNPPLDSGSES
jgi:hypothetical protein